MSRPSDGEDDPSIFADWAFERGYEEYEGITKMRQSAVNFSTVMLWHLLEQQMLAFHMRQVLSGSQEMDVRHGGPSRNKLFRLESFKDLLTEGGCPVESLASWAKLDELRLVANAVKHALGTSLDDLHAIRPDLLEPPGLESLLPDWGNRTGWVELPASGEDIYVKDSDLVEYFDAAENFWESFADAIEAHN